MALDNAVDHSEKRARVELGFRGDFRAGDAESLLQILFVADEHVDVLDDTSDHRYRAIGPSGNIPQLLAEIQIEGNHGAGFLSRLHALNDQFGSRLGKRGKDSAAVE